MTREEAFKIMKRPVGGEWEYDWIRRFVELGKLKLDDPEPPSAMTIFCKEMNWPEGGHSYQILFRSLEKAGLKIVEASSLPRPQSSTPEK
jgi:hypothetical protein